MNSLKLNVFLATIIKNITISSEYNTGKFDSGILSNKFFYNNPFNCTNKNINSPLIYSIQYKRRIPFDMLLQYSNISHINSFNKTAFTYACFSDDTYYANKIISEYSYIKSELKQASGLMALAYCLNNNDNEIKNIGFKILLNEYITKQNISIILKVK